MTRLQAPPLATLRIDKFTWENILSSESSAITSGSYISVFDPEMASLVKLEKIRQQQTINLIPSENYASPLATALEGGVFTNKNAEGYPGRRYVAGCEHADAVEALAISRLKSIFGCDHANVQGMSATIANVALLQAVLEPGDTILSMALADGGHLSHGAKFHSSGKLYKIINYGVNEKTETIDLDTVEKLAKEHKPKIIICGASSYPRNIDFAAFGEIARSVSSLLWADIAHTVGLIVAGIVPSPIPHADFVTSSTHKTWRGPRGGSIILCRSEWAARIDRAIFPGIQGAPKMDLIAARAVFFKETMAPEFKLYGEQMIKNAKSLAEGLREGGVRLVTGGTDTHLVLADVRSLIASGAKAQDLLETLGIITNRNPIPFDPAPAFDGSGLRLGSPAMTTRGMMEYEFHEIGGLIARSLRNHDSQATQNKIRDRVAELVSGYPLFAEKWQPQQIRLSSPI